MIGFRFPNGFGCPVSVCLATVALFVSACSADGQAASTPEPGPQVEASNCEVANCLWLSADEQDGQVVVRASRTSGDSVDPRVMEVRVRVTGARFVSAEAAEATQAAGKQLVAQATDYGARFILFSSSNTHTIGAGDLFRARFEPTGDGDVSADILTDAPIMAPEEAAVGLHLGDPVTL